MVQVKVKVKFTLEQAKKPRGGCSSTLSLTSALDGDWWSTPLPGRFTPGKDPLPFVQKVGWAPGPVWMGAENLGSTGIQTLDRPAHSESLYRLSYPGPHTVRSFYYFII